MAACCEKAQGPEHDGQLCGSPEPNKNTIQPNKCPDLTVSQIMGDAEEYVDAIMASQNLNPAVVNNEDHNETHDLSVSNLNTNIRKRNLSLSSTDASEVKKARKNVSECEYPGSPVSADTPVTDRVLARARRSLYGGTPNGLKRTNEVDDSYEKLIMKKLDSISADIQKVNDTLSQRLTDEIKKVNTLIRE